MGEATMTTLTADEITTFAEVFGHELTVAQLTHLEEWVDAHRAEAIVMFIDEMTIGLEDDRE
jgi:hypothetical protein